MIVSLFPVNAIWVNSYIKSRPDLMKHLAELSDREKECLFWASEGKTSWEIATILGISERTVNFHLNQVTNKTDSKNRNQAIAKSISSVSALESASFFPKISSSHLKSITSSLDFHYDHSRTC